MQEYTPINLTDEKRTDEKKSKIKHSLIKRILLLVFLVITITIISFAEGEVYTWYIGYTNLTTTDGQIKITPRLTLVNKRKD